MSTTAHQTWVRRASCYFTDSAEAGYTYRVSPALGTVWCVSRQAYGTDTWEPVGSHTSLAKAKAAALAVTA